MAVLNSPDEKDLVLRLNDGDRSAFDHLYHVYSRKLLYHLKKLTYSEDIAQELLQEVFIRLWVKRADIDVEKSLSAYLYRIAANLAYDFFRKAALDRKLSEQLIASGSELYDHIEALIDYKEHEQLIENAIAALPPQRQKIFRLCKMDGKSYEEVGTLLGISPSTVHDHIVKASKAVKQQLFASRETAITLLLLYLLKK